MFFIPSESLDILAMMRYKEINLHTSDYWHTFKIAATEKIFTHY